MSSARRRSIQSVFQGSRQLTWLLPLSMLGGIVAACSSDEGRSSGGGPSGNGGTINGTGGSISGIGGSGAGSTVFPGPTCTANCTDFPEAPIFDMEGGAISDADVAPFANPETFTPGTMCVTEPQLGTDGQPGAMFPANWLRPRFKWTPAAGDTLFEIRLTNEIETHALVAYTRKSEWVMPEEIWTAAAKNVHTPITVTIRGTSGGAVNGMRGTFQIAPVYAAGSLVFWATTTKKVSKDGSFLMSFTVGSDAVAKALDLTQVQTKGVLRENGQSLRDDTGDANKPGHQPGDVQCIGCHQSTPDGDAVVFVDDWPWDKAAAMVDPDNSVVGARPSYITEGSQAMLNQPFMGTPTFNENYWSAGNRLMVTSSYSPRSDAYFQGNVTWPGGTLIWMNLESDLPTSVELTNDPNAAATARNAVIKGGEGNAWGTLALDGETRAPVVPDWSNDGTKIAYTSTNNPDNGHPSKTDASVESDIHVVPYNAGKGGTVAPLAGASVAGVKEYYPAFSPHDAQVAFNRAASGAPYYNATSEIYVVPASGGTAVSLVANSPPACTGETSPGVTNSWAKWSPEAVQDGGKTYYFVTFSSTRKHDGQFDLVDPWGGPTMKSAQLYMAVITVDDASGAITTYPAVYLWNQNRRVVQSAIEVIPTSNLTPAWDNFKIPPPLIK